MQSPNDALRLAVIATLSLLAPASASAQIRPELLLGTWEQVSSRNLEGGALDDILATRATWLQFTPTVASQIWMSRDRAVIQPEDLARMSPEARRVANYNKIWGDDGQPRFSALAGFYHLDGARMYFTLILNLQPSSTNVSGMDTIVQLDAERLVYRTGRTRFGFAREQTYRRVDGASAGARTNTNKFDPRDLIGTWQTLETRNLKTGEVQRAPETKTVWFHISDSTWTYITMDKDRPIVTPDQLAGMPAADRIAANYGKIWNESGGTRFWGSAGTYRLDDDKITFVRRVISMEPHMVKVNEATETIVRLDREMYITRSAPDKEGVVTEFVSRRVD